MKAIHILGLLSTTAWAFFIAMGFGTIGSITQQHAVGYPSSAQIFFNVWIPIIFVAAVVVTWALGRKDSRRSIAITVIALSLVAIAPYLLLSGGGV